jgi:hypothetical protein
VTLPLWRALLERIGFPHVRASLDSADPSRAPASRRRTGVLLGSRAALRDPSSTLPVPWAETALAALADDAIGPVEIHCLHVPNAANGWVKAHTLRAIRAGLQLAPKMPRVVCGDLVRPRLTRPAAARARTRMGRGRAGHRAGVARPGLPGRLSLPPRLRIARAELDVAAHLGAWRWLAPRPPVHLGRVAAGRLCLPPLLAQRGPERPLGTRGRHHPKRVTVSFGGNAVQPSTDSLGNVASVTVSATVSTDPSRGSKVSSPSRWAAALRSRHSWAARVRLCRSERRVQAARYRGDDRGDRRRGRTAERVGSLSARKLDEIEAQPSAPERWGRLVVTKDGGGGGPIAFFPLRATGRPIPASL